MNKSQRFIDLFNKLINLTRDKKVVWSSSDKRQLILDYPNADIQEVFLGSYNHRLLRLYRYRYKEYGSNLEDLFKPQKGVWKSKIRLEVIDEKSRPIWKAPEDIKIIEELFQVVLPLKNNLK